MVLSIPNKKNAKLNAAVGGFAQGFAPGIALGQRSRQIQGDEQAQAFYQQQVIRKAQLADQELQREQGLRQATGQMAQEMATTPQPSAMPQGNSMGQFAMAGPAVAAATGQASIQQQLERVGGIAKKMAEMGASPRDVQAFIGITKEKHKAILDEQRRKTIVGKVGKGIAAGGYFSQQPDGTRLETPAMTDALDKWSKLAADPNTPYEMLEQQKSVLDREQIISKSTFKHVQDTVQTLQSKIAQAGEASTQTGQVSPSRQAAESEKMQRLNMLASTYEHLAPQLMSDPKEWREWQQKFWKQWSLTEAGYSHEDKDGQGVPFEYAQQQRKMEMESKQREAEAAQWKGMAEQTQAALNEARIPFVKAQADAVPEKVKTDRMNAETDRIKAEKVDAPEPPKPAISYKDAAAIVDARDEKLDPSARRDAIRAEMQTAEAAGGAPDPSEGVKPGSDSKAFGPQWPEWVLKKQEALPTRAAREADIRANPEKYRGKFKTPEELEAFLNGG